VCGRIHTTSATRF
jgi:hypothetical protein